MQQGDKQQKTHQSPIYCGECWFNKFPPRGSEVWTDLDLPTIFFLWKRLISTSQGFTHGRNLPHMLSTTGQPACCSPIYVNIVDQSTSSAVVAYRLWTAGLFQRTSIKCQPISAHLREPPPPPLKVIRATWWQRLQIAKSKRRVKRQPLWMSEVYKKSGHWLLTLWEYGS